MLDTSGLLDAVAEVINIDLEPEFHPHQYEAFTDYDSFKIILRTGYGGGKTFLGGYWTIDRIMLNPPGSHGLVMSPVYDGHELFTIPALKAACAFFGIKWRRAREVSEGGPEAVFNKNDKTITLPGDRVVFLKTADDPEHAAGGTCVCAWLDECSQYSEKAFEVADTRVRDPKAVVLQILYTSTPRGTRSAMHAEEIRGRQMEGYLHVIHAPTSANTDLPKRAVEAALLRFKNNPAGMRQFFEGIATDDSGNIYTQLTGGNIRKCDNVNAGQIVTGWDFNVKCMVTTIGTISLITRKLHIWGEVVSEGEAFIEDHAQIVKQEILKRTECVEIAKPGWPPMLHDQMGRPVLAFPDASGSRRHGHTGHTAIANAGFTLRVNKSNPPVEDRIVTVQHALANYDAFIDPFGAKDTLRALQEHSRNKHGEPRKHWNTEEFQADHYCDAFGYTVCGLMPLQRNTAWRSS